MGSQSPRELVRRTLEFDGPERVPRQLWLLPWAAGRHPADAAEISRRFPDDIVHAPAFFKIDPPGRGDRYAPGTSTDEWGCVFENIHEGAIGQVKKPLLSGWSRLDAIRFPEERLTVDREKVNAFCRETDRFVLSSSWIRPFERLQFLRGTENLFFDLADRPAELFSLIDRLHDFYIRELEVWAATEVDGLTVMDDWGTQDALLISPATWQEIFKPLYRDYIEIAHAAGKALFFHSDGHITEILPHFVELGLDAVNSQVGCMGIEELGKRFGGKLTFWGELDRQQILPYGSRDDVRGAVSELREAFYRNGGVIAQCEFGLGAKPDNVISFFEAWEASC